ncbi:DUF115 domain-containing protein [Entomospira entomophila]|uniref:Motility associated factor glycosyltransferase family protein n=1 Tax=Entomospira entomophila TaxID=2719988 RepID=A0A968G7Q8_9SPIO|nr:6-hydroxymethylpterin diphosphokinase MptE-like protein [Entomospira entomophilus]NIZ40152.1 motility associated factor glycosyltransferase family protein [Entomospira entomophilus]WDI35710.1 DUF115 domain-containing protein [Entomospira entomophilus]
MPSQITDRFPFLQIRSNTPSSLRVEPSRSGEPTLIHHHMALHSRYDPIREAQRDIKQIPHQADVILIAGFGLGYIVDAVIENYPNIAVIIIEPEAEYFILANQHRDLQNIAKHAKITILHTEQVELLTKQLLEWQSEHPFWLELRTRTNMDTTFFEPYRLAFKQYQQRVQTNRLTLGQYSWLWWRNGLKNRQDWITMKPVSHLFHQFQEMPILVIAAGPSLSYHIESIKLLQERMLLICVETALRILLHHDVRPDIVVSIDSQYWNARHLDNLQLADILYVLEGSVHPMLIRNIPKTMRYLMDPLTPIFQPLKSILPPMGSLRSGGSVSITAWDLALQMNPSSIWCLGFDFAYPHAATHAKGALFEEWLVASASRLNPVTMQQHLLVHQKSILVPNHHGEMIRSDARMQLYQQWIEEALTKEKIPSYNLSSLGALIRGMSYKSIKEAGTLPYIRPRIDNILQKVKQLPSVMIDHASISKQFQKVNKELDNAINTIRELNTIQEFAEFQQSISSSLMQFSLMPYIRYWLDPLQQSAEQKSFLAGKECLLIKLEALSTAFGDPS